MTTRAGLKDFAPAPDTSRKSSMRRIPARRCLALFRRDSELRCSPLCTTLQHRRLSSGRSRRSFQNLTLTSPGAGTMPLLPCGILWIWSGCHSTISKKPLFEKSGAKTFSNRVGIFERQRPRFEKSFCFRGRPAFFFRKRSAFIFPLRLDLRQRAPHGGVIFLPCGFDQLRHRLDGGDAAAE